MEGSLDLAAIRSSLVRLEETIIFSLIERAQFGKNLAVYHDGGVPINGYSSSYLMYLLHETEIIHARVGRYTAPDEHPFTRGLPGPFITPIVYKWPINRTEININGEILDIYIKNIIPSICETDDDGNYGSSVVNDITVLQSLSKRIHYGEFVAESKFSNDKSFYSDLIMKNNYNGLINALTDRKVEKALLERVELKASAYGRDTWTADKKVYIKPRLIMELYRDYIIPLTKKVEALYLLEKRSI